MQMGRNSNGYVLELCPLIFFYKPTDFILPWVYTDLMYFEVNTYYLVVKSQACHAEGHGFAPGTLQGLLFTASTTITYKYDSGQGTEAPCSRIT